ncbi:MAG: MBL fold metallo-hydrolase [Promethearchaeota archaeon]
MPWIQEEGKFSESISILDSYLLGLPYGLDCYLIQGSEKTVLVDVAAPQEALGIIEKLKREKIKPDVIILTHAHWDHALGVPIFQKEYPNIEIMVGETGVRALKNNKIFNGPFANLELLPDLEPIEGLISVKEGELVNLGGIDLSIIETPGHSNCSITIFEPSQKILFVGDAIGNIWTLDFSMPPTMPPEFSEEKFFMTLDKIRDIDYESLAFSHHGILTGTYAKNFPDKAKSSYIDWRDFFVDMWNENPNQEYLSEKFKEKLNTFGFHDDDSVIKFNIYGSWILEGLKSGKIIQ